MKHTLLLMAMSAMVCFSQSMNTGTFVGTVKDPTGAAIPGAKVRILRENPPLTREVTADAEGNYQAVQLQVGEYRVEFSHEGFKSLTRTGIALSAGQSLRVDGEMTVGSVADSVNVDTKVAQVDTTSANVGSTVYGEQVKELALNTRSFTQLMTLQPGVSSQQAQQPGFGSNTSVPFSFNGGQTSSNNWLLDGGRNIDTYNGNNLTMVNLDAIAEVRIERNAYASEFGRNGGAQINVITKSGTNQFHGSGFEFFRNDKLDARNFFARTRPKNRYNNFGWTLGGPIKRDKLFFFLSNEYRRIQQATSTRTSIVPTDAQLAGDFSATRAIKDPNGVPYPNNVIPSSQIDPNALVLLRNYYARPTPGFQSGALNFSSTEPDGTRYRSALGRVDYNISPKLTFFGRYNIDSTRLISPYGLAASNVMPGVGASEQAHIMVTANASLNYTISPTVLNQFTSAWYHGSMVIAMGPQAIRSPQFTSPRVFDTQTDSSGFVPSLSLSQGYAGLDVRWPQNISSYSFELIDNLSVIRGNHSFKFGGTLDKENKSQNQSNPNNNGAFTFNGGVTGDALADLLIGRAFQYQENSNHIFGSSRWINWSLYAQDQWRVHPRLSLTYGLRYEFYQPEKDKDRNYSFFLPSRFNAAQAATVLPSGQIVTGTQNYGNGIVQVGPDAPFGYAVTNTVKNTFAPRAGFSYTATKDNLTVVRGGFGMFHDRWPQNVSTLRNNYPFNQNASIFNTFLSNPAGGERRYFPIGITNFASPWNIPYMMKWSLGVQRQLPAELMVDVSYVGSRGVGQLITRDINQPVANATVAGGSVSPNAVRPYLGFAGITTYETSGNSIYHSLQTAVTRRLSRGLSVQGSYTWSKIIDNTVTPMNSYAASGVERAMASFDRTHVAVLSWVYELPFARGSSGWKKAVFGGWQVSGIGSFQSGNPLTITIPTDRAGVGTTTQRPNLTGSVDRIGTQAKWFTTDVFALPALGTFGNAGRSLVRGPGICNFDTSFSKRWSVTERVQMQFRGEFFNLFNHTQWAGVSTSTGAATFGQVTSARDPRITQLGLRLQF